MFDECKCSSNINDTKHHSAKSALGDFCMRWLNFFYEDGGILPLLGAKVPKSVALLAKNAKILNICFFGKFLLKMQYK